MANRDTTKKSDKFGPADASRLRKELESLQAELSRRHAKEAAPVATEPTVSKNETVSTEVHHSSVPVAKEQKEAVAVGNGETALEANSKQLADALHKESESAIAEVANMKPASVPPLPRFAVAKDQPVDAKEPSVMATSTETPAGTSPASESSRQDRDSRAHSQKLDQPALAANTDDLRTIRSLAETLARQVTVIEAKTQTDNSQQVELMVEMRSLRMAIHDVTSRLSDLDRRFSEHVVRYQFDREQSPGAPPSSVFPPSAPPMPPQMPGMPMMSPEYYDAAGRERWLFSAPVNSKTRTEAGRPVGSSLFNRPAASMPSYSVPTQPQMGEEMGYEDPGVLNPDEIPANVRAEQHLVVAEQLLSRAHQADLAYTWSQILRGGTIIFICVAAIIFFGAWLLPRLKDFLSL